MNDFDHACEAAVRDQVVNSLALVATHKDETTGSKLYSKYLGSPSSTVNGRPVDAQTVFALASYTKLPTSIAALKVVEEGLIGLDDDVAGVLPDLAKQQILTGFTSDGAPILQPRQNRLTLRHLLTHSAGLGYDLVNPQLKRYQAYRGRQLSHGPTLEERLDLPLLYEPGTSWEYGCSVDWAGKLVERLKSTTLESFLAENVWKPLGVSSYTFWPHRNKDIERRLATQSFRIPETGKLKPLPKGLRLNIGVADCFGGSGAYSDAETYMALLRSLLANDGKVLQKQTVDLFFQCQLSSGSRAALQAAMADPSWAVGDFYPGEEYDWGLGGLLITKAAGPGPRRSGSMVWSGVANLFWFIDRSAELCGMFMTQVVPEGDPAIEDLIKAYQKVVYRIAADKNGQPKL
ncbi:beta-lactamase [Paramyrothecium foliicola]|nr:beta-lactamase [Paramyrothecium foliicola]